jgi:uncharacterized integral membrane protein
MGKEIGGTMGIIKGAIVALLLAAGIGFAIQNDQPIALAYYFGWESAALPLFLWVFLGILIGLILSGVLATLSKVGYYSQIRQRKKVLAELEQERSNLRQDRL